MTLDENLIEALKTQRYSHCTETAAVEQFHVPDTIVFRLERRRDQGLANGYQLILGRDCGAARPTAWLA